VKKSPSLESNKYSATQEITLILWNPKVHNRIHKSSPFVPTLTQIDPAMPASLFSKIQFNIKFPSTPWSS
jgi:hypothetical protein